MFGLIGRKLSHSFSPQIHKELGDYTYKLWEMEEEDVAGFLKKREFDGTNVTIPYKKTVIPFLDEISPIAQRIGAVNTIVKRADGTLYGDNTDYFGFSHMLSLGPCPVDGKKCIVLGSGGASLTVINVLKALGAGSIVVISRTGENNYTNLHLHYDADIIVNTTPVGMYPNCGESPIELSNFTSCKCVYDLIYNPAKTALLLQAEALGIPYVNGLSMLVAQGKRAAELFLSTQMDDSLIESITKKLSLAMLNVVLIGMPGCGKSTVGRLIAEKLDRRFEDTDVTVELNNNRRIPDIINTFGEDCFRDLEQEAVADICKQSGLVIATGGGAILRQENRNAIRQNAVVVFINRDMSDLETQGRPLSSTPEKLKKLYDYRLPIYRQCCDVEVTTQPTPQQTAELILKEIGL